MIERVAMDDFTGGQAPRLAATDFSERQWAAIKGLVLEDPTRLRTQWACQRVGGAYDGFDELRAVRGRLVARKPDGTFWWTPYLDTNLTAVQTKAAVWTQITAITADTNLHIQCQVPWRAPDDAGTLEGLLINGVNRAGNAYVLVPVDATMQVKSYPRYPSGDALYIPPAEQATMWGDFLVLADIRWLKDGDSPFTEANSTRHATGLWFSSPTDVGVWDVLDVAFVSLYDDVGSDGNAVIRAMHQLPAGLMVLLGSGIGFLRGNAADYANEPLRTNIGIGIGRASTFWGHTGNVMFCTSPGRLYATNGEEFSSVSDGVSLDAATYHFVREVAPLMAHLIAVVDDGTEGGVRMMYLRALETEAIWGELTLPTAGARQMVSQEAILTWLDDTGQVWRFTTSELVADERGLADGVPVEVRLATRTVERGGGHETTFWHRAGLRGKGPGKVKTVTLRPGPALDTAQPTLVHTLDETMGGRYEQVVRAHGPSNEASVDLQFEGDVQVEQVALFVHAGRGDR